MKVAITTDTHYGFMGDRTRKRHKLFLEKLQKAMADEDVKILIHTGDWITHRHEQLEKTFAQFRDYISCPILTVFGNHDFWNEKRKNKMISWENLLRSQAESLAKYNITHVGVNPVVIEGYLFAGFNGWYKSHNPPSNDLNCMPHSIEGKPTHAYLSDKAYSDLNQLIYSLDNFKYQKAVCLTHFPPFVDNEHYAEMCANPRYLEVIKEHFQVLVVGHSHQTQDFMDESLRILNAGAEYNEPRFIIVDI